MEMAKEEAWAAIKSSLVGEKEVIEQRLLEGTSGFLDQLRCSAPLKTTHPADTEKAPEVNCVRVNEVFLNNMSRAIKAIETALERMKLGIYDVCSECGETIPLERLKVMPFTELCLECQRIIEARSKLKH
jgi:RNA polymerase-binding transcription factor DksA